jgi:flagellar protein FlgJ
MRTDRLLPVIALLLLHPPQCETPGPGAEYRNTETLKPFNRFDRLNQPYNLTDDMATKKEQLDFTAVVYPAAKRLREKYDSIHPLFVTAQAALETGWKLPSDGTNNLFGITKGTTWNGDVKLRATTEYFSVPDKKFYPPEKVTAVEKVADNRYRYRVRRLFRVYPSPDACLDDHLALLKKPGYADAWPYRNDPKEYARRIVDADGAKYATAPDYAQLMAAVIDSVRKMVDRLEP